MLRESIGTDSLFEKRFGYHADILRPVIAETLPAGWESRLRPVPGYAQVFTLDRYDLALVKLMVGREKDLALLRALLNLGLIEPARLRHTTSRRRSGNGRASPPDAICALLEEPGTVDASEASGAEP